MRSRLPHAPCLLIGRGKRCGEGRWRGCRERPPQFFPGGGKGIGEAVDWAAFPGRFQATAGKVLAKMHSNALLMGQNLRRTVEELSGRGRGQ